MNKKKQKFRPDCIVLNTLWQSCYRGVLWWGIQDSQSRLYAYCLDIYIIYYSILISFSPKSSNWLREPYFSISLFALSRSFLSPFLIIRNSCHLLSICQSSHHLHIIVYLLNKFRSAAKIFLHNSNCWLWLVLHLSLNSSWLQLK